MIQKLKFKRNYKITNNFVVNLKKVPIDLTYGQIVSSNIHFGYSFFLMNPLDFDFIYGQRRGILFLDIRYTITQLKRATIFLVHVVSNRGKILYVDNFLNKKYTAELFFFYKLKQYFLNARWLVGFLTNFKFLYFELCKIFILSKKQTLTQDQLKYRLSYGGLRNIRRLPNVILNLNLNRNFWSASEAAILRLPSITFSEGGFDVTSMGFMIPGNVIKSYSIKLYVNLLFAIIMNGFLKEVNYFYNLRKNVNVLNYNSKKINVLNKNN
jgi:small subunit ribosomal protein S2